MSLLELEVDNLASVRDIQVAIDAVSHPSMAVFLETQVDAWVKHRVDIRFSQQGDAAVGGPWLRLTDVTNSFRERDGFPPANPINFRTGKLYDYLMNMSPDIRIMTFGGAEGVWPGDMPGDKWLNQKFVTAQVGRGRTPARPVLGLDMTDLTEISAQMAVYLAGRLGIGE